MRDKLRQLDETYLDLVIGILLCGVLSAILGMIITRGDLRYLIGAIVGTIFALVMITTMMVSIQKSVQMDTHQASRNMIKSALIRYVATLVILYVMIKLSMSAFIAALVGFLSSKFAAFLQNRFTSISRAEFYKNNVNHIFRVSNMEKEKIGEMENIIKGGCAMGIMNAPMMLAASSGDDVDFMVHGLIPLKFFGHKVWITTTHVTTLIVMVFIIVLALIARHAVLHGDEKPSGLQNFVEMIVEMLDNLVKGSMGRHWRPFVNYIGTIMVFIFLQIHLDYLA